MASDANQSLVVLQAFLAVPEGTISFMIARLHDEQAIYGAGLSLAIYASAFLLIWSWRYTAALVALTGEQSLGGLGQQGPQALWSSTASGGTRY